jgi:hypothetical protein
VGLLSRCVGVHFVGTAAVGVKDLGDNVAPTQLRTGTHVAFFSRAIVKRVNFADSAPSRDH